MVLNWLGEEQCHGMNEERKGNSTLNKYSGIFRKQIKLMYSLLPFSLLLLPWLSQSYAHLYLVESDMKRMEFYLKDLPDNQFL